MKKEIWECVACNHENNKSGERCPCRVEISYEDTNYKHVDHQDKFTERVCLCRNYRYPKWEKIIDKKKTSSKQQEKRTCPKCDSSRITTFTPDMDICEDCGFQMNGV